jgi:hypothetical protein
MTGSRSILCTDGGDKNCVHNFIQKTREKRGNLEDLGADGRIILKCILRKQVERVWTGLMQLRIWIVGKQLCT